MTNWYAIWNSLAQELGKLFRKWPDSKYLQIQEPNSTVALTPFWGYSMKGDINNSRVNKRGCVLTL